MERARMIAQAHVVSRSRVTGGTRRLAVRAKRSHPRRARCVQAQFAEVSEQVEIMKTTLSKSGNDHASSGQKNASLQAELGSKRARLDEIRSRVAANHRKLESEYSHLGGLGEKEKELTALSALEDKRLVEVRPLFSSLVLSIYFCGRTDH